MSLAADLFAEAVRNSRTEIDALAGVTAIIDRYYREYTDATSVESEFLEKITWILDQVGICEDEVLAAVVQAENDINEAGGIRGSNGSKHNVRTEHAHNPYWQS